MKYSKESEFLNLTGIEYFAFEEDFVVENVRCIPMIVRFKMDLAGIKLSLAAWSRFNVKERQELALRPCNKATEISAYKIYLTGLIKAKTNKEPSEFVPDPSPNWADDYRVCDQVQEQAAAFGWHLSSGQWQGLSQLQRFALLKLCRPGHENDNFPVAMKEFNLAGREINFAHA